MPRKVIATYRIQLQPGFGFDQLTAQINYLKDLGISHIYTSPFLQAAKGSVHGYDIVDPTKINSELGSPESQQRFFEKVKSTNLGLMIDVVPNHMAILGQQNPWWWDVLKYGSTSKYAKFFDVDWDVSYNKILLPVLSDHYGRVLEKGEFKLVEQDGQVILQNKDQSFPIDPNTLKTQDIRNLNQDINALDALIEKQNYRLAFWKTVSRDLGYRRFFDIKDLVGLRIEDGEVFHATHALPLKWVHEGWVEGLRIDHPDGLRRPAEYLTRLKEACPEAWIVVEKILEPGETLPVNWPVDGTTGYDFLNLVNELFIDSKNKEAFSKIYQNIIGEQIDFKELVYQCKRLVLQDLFGSELNRLTTLFVEICDNHRNYRDYTRPELLEALSQTAACFPVYRTYVSAKDGSISKEDEKVITSAIDLAMTKRPDVDPELFHFLKECLLLRIPGPLSGELAMRFQQLTGPVMAKGFEDTALYRYNRLIALNDVGGDPDQFGLSIKQFHESCQKGRTLSLLATTTHDTKRSEDVRARLALLSEIPEEWSNAVQRWIIINDRYRRNNFPERNIEYLFYQTLFGAWPIEQDRLLKYMEKAVHEAKFHTSWTKPNKDYEEAVRNFVIGCLQDQNFLDDFESFIKPLIFRGRLNSLAQTLIKLTAPGIPDIYQGSELWNMTLVDPDNRHPIDFEVRQKLLNEVKQLSVEEVMSRMEEGLPKLWLIHKVLHFRQQHEFGSYRPLYAEGAKADHVVAFLRGESVITIAPRCILNMKWDDTKIEIPSGSWENILTGDKLEGGLILVQGLLSRFPVAMLKKV